MAMRRRLRRPTTGSRTFLARGRGRAKKRGRRSGAKSVTTYQSAKANKLFGFAKSKQDLARTRARSGSSSKLGALAGKAMMGAATAGRAKARPSAPSFAGLAMAKGRPAAGKRVRRKAKRVRRRVGSRGLSTFASSGLSARRR